MGVRFSDYRRTNDAVSIADMGFKKQLWALDPELDVVWDWVGNRWEIWRFPGQGKKKIKKIDLKAHHVATVQVNGRNFRELGADVLLRLQAGDTQKYGVDQLMNYFDAMDDNLQRAKLKDFEKIVEAITWDSFDYVRGVTKKQVPLSYKVAKKDEKYLIDVPKETKVQRAIAGGY